MYALCILCNVLTGQKTNIISHIYYTYSYNYTNMISYIKAKKPETQRRTFFKPKVFCIEKYSSLMLSFLKVHRRNMI